MADEDGALSLALLFSIDDDATTLHKNEQGSLDPGILYGSFMDGSHFQVARIARNEDVDAVTLSDSTMANDEY